MIISYFNAFDQFIGDSFKPKQTYYKLLNFMFMSPFIPKLRYIAHNKGFDETYFRYFVILHGPKSAGKSEFVDTVQKLMFGKKLGRIGAEIFTKSGITTYQDKDHAAGIPAHINDVDKRRFTANAGEIIKNDDYLFDTINLTYPAYVITSNEITVTKKEIAKRVLYLSVNLTQEDIEAASKKKVLFENRKKLSTSFYRLYLKYMFPEIEKTISMMENYIPEENSELWNPDLFQISSNVIRKILQECDIEIPQFMIELNNEECFGNTVVKDNIREKILRDWKYNKEAFEINRKENELAYYAGENAYAAVPVVEALPEILKAKQTGHKVIMELDEAERFFGTKFSLSLKDKVENWLKW